MGTKAAASNRFVLFSIQGPNFRRKATVPPGLPQFLIVGVRSPALSAKASAHEVIVLKLKPWIEVRGKLWQQQQQQRQTLGRKGDSAVHASLYGKVQAGLTPAPDVQERRRKGGLLSSSYLYRLCVTCIHLSLLGVDTPLQNSIRNRGRN